MDKSIYYSPGSSNAVSESGRGLFGGIINGINNPLDRRRLLDFGFQWRITNQKNKGKITFNSEDNGGFRLALINATVG
ncbi:MAG: hypothetical protein ABI091_10450 [Ferruginibacter sp.]